MNHQRIKIVIYITLLCVWLANCSGVNDNISHYESAETESKMSDSIHESIENDRISLTIKDLGIPNSPKYSLEETAILPYDMVVFKGRLYIGSGDLSTNAGPVDIWEYNVMNREWRKSATLEEEEVSRFCVYDNVLYVPGLDSRYGWDASSFYTYDGEKWETVRSIPDSSHCFDILKHNDILFAAIEYERDTNYVYAAVSYNGGTNFQILPFLKNGNRVQRQNSVWAQNFFVINNKVYAYLDKGLYEYQQTSFNYIGDWHVLTDQRGMRRFALYGKAYIHGETYLSNGYLYRCSSNLSLEVINTPENHIVQDIYEYCDSLYVMLISYDGVDYITSVYQMNGNTGILETVFSFPYGSPAISFAIYENRYYFGMGSNDHKNTNNGRILEIEING